MMGIVLYIEKQKNRKQIGAWRVISLKKIFSEIGIVDTLLIWIGKIWMKNAQYTHIVNIDWILMVEFGVIARNTCRFCCVFMIFLGVL